jgi:hypothetical protein
MQTWNYRIVYEETNDEKGFSIREVYYNTDNQPTSWTGEVSPHCEELDDLVVVLKRIADSEPLMIETLDDGNKKLVQYKIQKHI